MSERTTSVAAWVLVALFVGVLAGFLLARRRDDAWPPPDRELHDVAVSEVL